MSKSVDKPEVSIAIACYNASAFLQSAMQSALDQSVTNLELIVIDDQSIDDSMVVAERMASADKRVRVDRLARNSGPAAARNRALELARGEWFAILDSDDLYHPGRLRDLLDEARRTDADMIADDLLIFDDTDSSPPSTFFAGSRSRRAGWVGLEDYLRETVLYGRHPNLGFLKPLVRTDFLRQHGLAYDERLRIAEDDDLILRILAAGARYRTVPAPTYFYRKHGASTSHRLSLANVSAMVAATARHDALLTQHPPRVRSAARARARSLKAAQDFTHFIEALKAGRPAQALTTAIRHPGLLPLLRMPLAARWKRLVPSPANAVRHGAEPRASIISRQRIVGSTNGSSAYLIDLANSARAAGMEPHLIQPSPAIFGRMPFFRLRPEMRVFASHSLRGAFRLGDWVFARDPRVYAQAARGVAGRCARRIGLRWRWTLDQPAPYAVTAPWEKADFLYVARHVRPRADRVIADYAFQMAAIPYVARPGVPTAIVMHDLFHARTAQFATSGRPDSVATIDRETECRLLAQADVVLAIQQQEADFVTQAVPATRALTVPVAVRAVPQAQPGDDLRLMFVGSNTAPNITGVEWLFEHVWPDVLRALPAIRLDVAGTVGVNFRRDVPANVRCLGLVDDLAELYAQSGVVISPLIHGSGLKIKLIEAMGHGKAIIASPITLQGVEEVAGSAVACAASAEDFVEAIKILATDRAARERLGAQALDVVRGHFIADVCHASFRAWLRDPTVAG